jgi:serine/threonine protein kinase
MDGGSLESRLLGPVSSGNGAPDILPLPWQQRLHIAAQIASALLYMHGTAGGIVHM